MPWAVNWRGIAAVPAKRQVCPKSSAEQSELGVSTLPKVIFAENSGVDPHALANPWPMHGMAGVWRRSRGEDGAFHDQVGYF
jgi:hypothetical protein